MFIVAYRQGGYWLRSTVATSDISRATRYETFEQAEAAIAKASKFQKGLHKKVTIEEIAS